MQCSLLFLWVRISLIISRSKERTNLLSRRERTCPWPDKWIISINMLSNATTLHTLTKPKELITTDDVTSKSESSLSCPICHYYQQFFCWRKNPGKMHTTEENPYSRLPCLQKDICPPNRLCMVTVLTCQGRYTIASNVFYIGSTSMVLTIKSHNGQFQRFRTYLQIVNNYW